MMRRSQRSGYLYIAVLSISMFVSVCGMAAITILHGNLRATTDAANWLKARNLADSAIAQALAQINSDPSWRSSFSHGVETTPVTIGQGTVAFRIEDTDGDLSDDAFDDALIYGIGRCGNAAFVRRVQIEPDGDGLQVLGTAVSVNDNFAPPSTVYWSIDADLYVNGYVDVWAPTSLISGHIRATSNVWHSGTHGTASSSQSELQFPPSDWPDYYETVGTAIDIEDLPLLSGDRQLSGVVLRKDSNPFGNANPLGIYVIDCDGEDLVIQNSRIAATVLIQNPGANSQLNGQVYWEPAIDNYPIVLVQGNFKIAHDPSPLDEAVVGINLNPIDLPYEGTSDSDLNDQYPSRLRGLIYVDGALSISQPGRIRTEIEGVVLCDSINVLGDVQVIHRPEIINDPPPGFRSSSQMRIVSSSWRRAEAN